MDAIVKPHAHADQTFILDPNAVTFLPLGGAGEIGMNLYLYAHKGKWLIVDCGVTFGDDTTPGVDVIMADPAFIEAHADDLSGIVLTHAHEDHLGAVAYLWRRLQCPVYATPFTAALLDTKLAEHNLGGMVPVHVMDLSSRFTVGPFDIEYVTLTHSIPEPNALAIRTDAGLVVHSGDFKFDPDPLEGDVSDFAALKRLGDEGVMALVSDSTNAMTEGRSGSEGEVRRTLHAVFGRYDKRIIVGCFATNVARLASIADAARAHGRDVALIGRSLWRIEAIARKHGFLKDAPPFVSEDEAGYFPREKIVYVCTGSQGEARAALSRIASQSHRHVAFDPGDVCLFSSRVIPGNETAILALQNRLVRLGVEVVTARDEPGLHVSGHPAREELKEMLGYLRPDAVIPMHGTRMHLDAHAKLALEAGAKAALVVENGEAVAIDASGVKRCGKVETGRLAVDGPGRLVPLLSDAMSTRRRMSFNGTVVVSVVLDRKGFLAADPGLSLLGVADDADADELYDDLLDAVEDAIGRLSAPARRQDDAVIDAVQVAVRRRVRSVFDKKPVTDVQVIRL